jgi:hypothetical protein
MPRSREPCCRSIGGRATQFADVATYRRVQVDFATAALGAFAAKLAPPLQQQQQQQGGGEDKKKKFRFVFVSGKGAAWDQEKGLSFLEDTRKAKVSRVLRAAGVGGIRAATPDFL